MGGLAQDLRYALRQLRKTPGFTATALLTLALGIGANAAIFTLVNSVLLHNLPVADPKMLVRFGNEDDCCVNGGTKDNGNYSLFPTETYELLTQNLPEFEELAAMQASYGHQPIVARRDGTQEARSVRGEFVSGNYFRNFGLQPRVGRLLADTDNLQGAPMTAVMSYETWQRDYAGDASVVGSTLWVNTRPVAIVGVAPQGFFGDRISSKPPDYYLPFESMPVLANVSYVHEPHTRWLYIIGRLKRGVAMGALQEKVNILLQQAFSSIPDYSTEQGKTELAKVHVVLTPSGAGIQQLQDQYSSHLRLLMWIAGLVLLIACANIANLLMVQGMSRRSELCVRTALGARRGRVIRQLLTECVVLAGLGGLAGMLVAYGGAEMLLKLAFPEAANVPIRVSPSLPILGFACSLSLVTGILFGVGPAWIASQTQPVEALRSGARATTAGASRVQRALVVLQAAVSLVLLVGAGLFSQSLNKLQSTDLKLDARNRYIVHINPQAAGYSPTQLDALYRTIEQSFHALPGVKKVGICTYAPMEDNNSDDSVQIQGQPPSGKGASWVRGNPEYFDSVGTHVIMGRGIGVQDTSTARTVAVVNQTFVKEFFKQGTNPIGQHFGDDPAATGDFEIVGVVEDTVYTSVYWKDHSMYFIPMTQRPASWKRPVEHDESMYAGAMVIETDRPMNDMEKLTRSTLTSINPNLTVVEFQTFSQQIADRFNDERLIAQLTMLFGVLALLLAAIGLYAVTAYTVARRTAEIGIRMAVGAERVSVITMVMRGAITQILLGLAIGIPIALVCVRFVTSQLYEITSADPTIVIGATAILAAAAFIAGIIPARRAASIDPVQALRTE
jgi:macrolide transport system ATP-binding/permease protein